LLEMSHKVLVSQVMASLPVHQGSYFKGKKQKVVNNNPTK